MSLLEDVFLEDEAGEAQELERVIEGDEYDELPRATSPNSDENSEQEDEAEEDKRRVDPTKSKPKKVVKNPRFILNPARLTGPRGIQVIPEHFKDFKFKGKGNEKEDLDLILKKLEHWAYRLYPKFEFEDCLKKIETLGKKRPVMVHLHKIRTDQFASEEFVMQKDTSDEEETIQPEEDEFDKLLQQQIELARATPAPSSVKNPQFNTPHREITPLIMPKATSSPSISNEQRERILKNRKLAEERRLARLIQNTDNKTFEIEVNKSRLINNISPDNELNVTNEVISAEILTNKSHNIQKEADNLHVTNVDPKEILNVNSNYKSEQIYDSDIELEDVIEVDKLNQNKAVSDEENINENQDNIENDIMDLDVTETDGFKDNLNEKSKDMNKEVNNSVNEIITAELHLNERDIMDTNENTEDILNANSDDTSKGNK